MVYKITFFSVLKQKLGYNYYMSKKIWKLVLFFFLIFFVGTISFFLLLFYLRSSEEYPYPYQFANSFMYSNKVEISNSDIIFLGDKMGVQLGKYENEIQKYVKTKTQLKFKNLSLPGEGLHRTLLKLKNLSSKPKLIIYHGGSDEFRETVYLFSQIKKIQANIQRFKSPITRGISSKASWITKIIFTPMEKKIIPIDIPQTKTIVPKEFQFLNFEINNSLYYLHLHELIHYSKLQNIPLLIITTPINLEIMPKSVCLASSNKEIMNLQNEIFQLYKNQEYKLALSRVKELVTVSKGNALNYYLLGILEAKNGLWDDSRMSLEMASSFDCGFWRTNLVNNQILIDIANKNEIKVIDFHAMIHLFWGKNTLFVDEIYPQHLYYTLLAQAIGESINSFLEKDKIYKE